MSESTPLYNSRVTKIYVQYISNYYPDIEVDSVLEEAGIANYEIEDPAHWFTQEQQDRLHDILVARTGNPNIAREAGRYSTSTKGLGATKQYALGLMSPKTIYLLLEKIYALWSRGADVRAKKIGSNQVEITAVPKPGVNEKPYQCENRRGMFESLAHLFTDKYAQINHPACVHQGDDCCRYIISWTKSPKIHLKLIRNYTLLLSMFFLLVLLFFLPATIWAISALGSSTLILLLSYFTEILEKKALIQTIETQKEAAQDNILESNIGYNNALLVQEIGQATSNILDIDNLLKTVAGVMEKRLDFDRGMIMLVNKEKTVLRYCTGYGQNQAEEEILKNAEFHLDNPDSKGLFVLAIKEQRPFLINNIEEIQESLSQRSFEVARKLSSKALICVPIVYENKALGILAVDNSKSSRPLRQTDMSLLIGVASQLAISMANAMSFEKLHNSEKKYRELVENANSIILRVDTEGKISYFNEFAQHFFGYSEKELIGKNAGRIILPAPGPNQLSFAKLISSMRNAPSQHMVCEI